MTLESSVQTQQKIKRQVSDLVRGELNVTTPRELAKLPGRLINQMPAIGALARILTKAFAHYISATIAEAGLTPADRHGWDLG
jgi:hypothetical protein